MIKDVPLVDSINGSEKIPVSDGSNEPKTVSISQIKDFVEFDDVDMSEYAKKTEIPTKLSELEQDIEVGSNSPIIKGDAKNSAVLKGEYQGYENKAISQTSMAIGAATTAGLKGWYYSAIDFTNKKITLSDKPTYILVGTTLINGGWSSGAPNIKVDDVISLVNDSKYDLCSKVTAVSGNVITVDSLPFTELVKDNGASVAVIAGQFSDGYSVYVPERPDAGLIDFGGGAFSEGSLSKATNIASHAEGLQTHAYGQYSHTEGRETKAGYAAHAEGLETHAKGYYSHSEGTTSIAEGNGSHAEGYGTQSKGNYSHSEGRTTKAIGANSHAEGRYSGAFAEGSHAEGFSTDASGLYSHAEGYETKARNQSEHACGIYNLSTQHSDAFKATQFSIGIGTSNEDRKNAFEVKRNGDVYIIGVGGYDGTNSSDDGTNSSDANDLKSVLDEKPNKTELATINGQSLTNGGNIVIEGKNYDAELAEQEQKLTELSAEVSELSEKVDELEKGGQGGGASVEGQTLIFSASSSAQVIGNTLKL